MDRLNRAAVDTRLGPKFYYVKNPPMSFFDFQVGPPQIAVGQVNAKGAALGAIELASIVPTAKVGQLARAAESIAPRTFTSPDPLVANLANDIEALYPGHVIGVNVPIINLAGKLVTDAEIQLQNAIIQVKSGGGKGLTSQLLRTERATGVPVIGYGPTLKPSVVRSINQSGGMVTTDRDLLIKVVKP